jgi:hypothetical protein
MPVFIADHQAKISLQSKFLRPIHIGAALQLKTQHGVEPDLVSLDSLSSQASYADIRVFHHIRNAYDESARFVAIFQYRRMYFLGRVFPWQKHLLEMRKSLPQHGEGLVQVDNDLRDLYLKNLSKQSDHRLRRELGDYDFVVNRHDFGSLSIENQYLDSTRDLYPGQPEYLDAWYNLRAVLNEMVGVETVSKCLDGSVGYFNNCFVSEWSDFVSYYDFLFEVLDKLSDFRELPRVYGYLAERIFGIYLETRHARLQSRSLMFFG